MVSPYVDNKEIYLKYDDKRESDHSVLIWSQSTKRNRRDGRAYQTKIAHQTELGGMRGGVSVIADLERNDRAAISHEDRIGFVVHNRESGCNDGDGKMFGRSTAKAGNSGKINNGAILHIGGDIDGAKGWDIDSVAGSDGAETAFGLQYQDITIVGRQGDEAFRGILIAEVGEGEIER